MLILFHLKKMCVKYSILNNHGLSVIPSRIRKLLKKKSKKLFRLQLEQLYKQLWLAYRAIYMAFLVFTQNTESTHRDRELVQELGPWCAMQGPEYCLVTQVPQSGPGDLHC